MTPIKPCFTCKVPIDGKCCLDETMCVDIEKWEKLHNDEQCQICKQKIRNELLDEIIHDYDSGDHPEMSDCDTTDEWYGHGWDDCRFNFVENLKGKKLSGD
jgi:hypothetical protein